MENGEVAEWLKAPVSKTGRGENSSWVQISPSPLEVRDKRRRTSAGVLVCEIWSPIEYPSADGSNRGTETVKFQISPSPPCAVNCNDRAFIHLNEKAIVIIC